MMTTLAPQIGAYLGGPAVMGRTIESEYDLVEAVQEGLPIGVVEELLTRNLLTAQEVDELILPRRTLSHRRANGDRLTLDESDRLSRVARVLAYAVDTFGADDAARHWLRQRQYGLRGQVPIALLNTTEGARLVEDELTRIASGDLA